MRSVFSHCRERHAIDELHREERWLVGDDLVHRDDVRMLQLRERAAFAHEAVVATGMQPLECDRATELDILGAPDRAHPAATDRLADHVTADALAGAPYPHLVVTHQTGEQRATARALVDVLDHRVALREWRTPDERDDL